MKRRIGLAVAAAGVLACAPLAPPIRRDAIGINMHPERATSAAAAEREFADCRDLGIRHARVAVEWAVLEPEAGRYDFAPMDRVVSLAEAHDVELLEVLGYNTPWNTAVPGNTKTRPVDLDAFSRFVRAMAQRYRGRIHAWEVWNEPNVDAFLTGPYAADPAARWRDYAAIVKAAREALKLVDPANVVVLGGLAHASNEWWADLEACYAAGVIESCDVIAIHPYAGGHPEHDPHYSRYIDEMLAVMARHGDSARPVWITEAGLPSAGHELAVTEAVQGEQVEPTFRVALARPQIKRVYYYALRDDAESFGIFRADGTPKPAAAAFRRMCTTAR